jgi:hypothetical protein
MGKDVSQVRHEVEAARGDVAEAVEALVYKLNAPKRLKERVATTVRTAKERTTTKASDAKEQVAERIGDLGGNGDTTAEAPPVRRPEPGVAPTGPEGNLS